MAGLSIRRSCLTFKTLFLVALLPIGLFLVGCDAEQLPKCEEIIQDAHGPASNTRALMSEINALKVRDPLTEEDLSIVEADATTTEASFQAFAEKYKDHESGIACKNYKDQKYRLTFTTLSSECHNAVATARAAVSEKRKALAAEEKE